MWCGISKFVFLNRRALLKTKPELYCDFVEKTAAYTCVPLPSSPNSIHELFVLSRVIVFAIHACKGWCKMFVNECYVLVKKFSPDLFTSFFAFFFVSFYSAISQTHT